MSPLVIGKHEFESRLFLGTGKYEDLDVMQRALEVSGTQCVTVAVRRMKLGVPAGKTLLDYLDRDRYVLLPNTAGCFTAEDAAGLAKGFQYVPVSDPSPAKFDIVFFECALQAQIAHYGSNHRPFQSSFAFPSRSQDI